MAGHAATLFLATVDFIMPIPVFEYPVTVLATDIDEMDHANNVCYIRWMQEAAITHSTLNGWPTERYIASQWAWVARRHTIDYLQPAFLGDELIVRTWVADFKHVRSRRKYMIVRKSDGATLATAETNWAFVSTESRRPIKIPNDVKECFILVGESASEPGFY
jgi:acyl-CoA thioester hydrolase